MLRGLDWRGLGDIEDVLIWGKKIEGLVGCVRLVMPFVGERVG